MNLERSRIRDSDWNSKKRKASPKQSLRPRQILPADHSGKFLMKQLGATTTIGNTTMVTSISVTTATTPNHVTGFRYYYVQLNQKTD